MWVYITSRKMTPHQNCSISAELDNNSDDSEAPEWEVLPPPYRYRMSLLYWPISGCKLELSADFGFIRLSAVCVG